MNAIFDTNAVYYLDSKLSKREFEKLIMKTATGDLSVFISPLTVIEMSSRLIENPSDFKKVQNAIKKLFKLNPTFLPDPEQQLAEYVLNSKIDPNDYKHWKEIFYTITVAPNVTKLETGFDVETSDKLSSWSRMKVNHPGRSKVHHA